MESFYFMIPQSSSNDNNEKVPDASLQKNLFKEFHEIKITEEIG